MYCTYFYDYIIFHSLNVICFLFLNTFFPFQLYVIVHCMIVHNYDLQLTFLLERQSKQEWLHGLFAHWEHTWDVGSTISDTQDDLGIKIMYTGEHSCARVLPAPPTFEITYSLLHKDELG